MHQGAPMMQVIALGDRQVALRADTPPVEGDRGWTVASSSIAILHPWGDTDFYRHGWNSWSPSGWARLSGDTIGIRGDPARLLTADDAELETAHRHSGSAVGALDAGDGNVLLLGALTVGSARVGADT